MPLVRRGRPLARAAIVGGAAYGAGKHAQAKQQQQQSYEQDQQSYSQAPPPPAPEYAAPPPPPAPAAAAPQADMVEQLKQLADLKAAGALSDQEFEAAKQKLLAG